MQHFTDEQTPPELYWMTAELSLTRFIAAVRQIQESHSSEVGMKEAIMSEERKQILEMLAQGKISAEDAERLLDKLGAGDSKQSADASPSTRDSGAKPKYLRVHVDSAEGDKVNIRIPLALIRTGIKLTTLLPDHATESLGEHGVDLNKLSELDQKELYETLSDLTVDVDSEEGDTVRVFCE